MRCGPPRFLLTPLRCSRPLRARRCAIRAVERGVALAFPRDHGSHPAFRTEWWYITGLGARRARQRLRRAGHVLPHPPGRGRRQREPLRADAAPVRARGDRRSAHRPAAARPARRARGLRASRRRAKHTTDVAIGDWSLRLAGDTLRRAASSRATSRSRLRSPRAQPLLLQGDARREPQGSAPTRRRATTTAGRSSRPAAR